MNGVLRVVCLPQNLRPLLLQALCIAPATKSALQVHKVLCLQRNLRNLQRPSGDHASIRSSCRLCVLRLPQNLRSSFRKCCARSGAAQRRPRVHPLLLKALSIAPVTQSAVPVAKSARHSCRLCVLRLPRNLQSRPRNLRSRFTKRCACGEICTTAQRRPPFHPALFHMVYSPATKSALQVHQVLSLRRNLRKRQLRPSGDHTSIQPSCRLCVLRLPRICAPASPTTKAQRRPRVHPVLLQALCTAPATKSALQVHQVLCLRRNLRDKHRDPAATSRPSSPLAGSVYCACHEICGVR